MFSEWWEWKKIIFFELLPNNQTINQDVYCRQLNEIDAAMKQKRSQFAKRKSVAFLHDNTRSHTNLVTRQKHLQLKQNILPYPLLSCAEILVERRSGKMWSRQGNLSRARPVMKRPTPLGLKIGGLIWPLLILYFYKQ